MKDKNNITIRIMDIVDVPAPNNSDIHSHEFQGRVVDLFDDGTIIVEDQDSDMFEIEANRVSVCLMNRKKLS